MRRDPASSAGFESAQRSKTRPDEFVVSDMTALPSAGFAGAIDSGGEGLGGGRRDDTADRLMADAEPDFVDICTPPSSHAMLIRQALERGAHVLCEKPLVGSLEELRALVDLAAGTGRVLHTVHNWHHAPIVRQTRALVADG